MDETWDVTVLLNINVISVKMKNCHGVVVTINVKDIPIGAYGLDDMLPQYSPLLINTFGAMSRLTSLKSISSLSIVIPKEARSTLLYTAVEGFTSPEWRHLSQSLKNLGSLTVPLSLALLPMRVVLLSSSDYTMVCLRMKQVFITTDIPDDKVHNKPLRRITKFVEARYDAGFALSSLDADFSVATPIHDQAWADYIETWESSVGEVSFSVQF